MYCLPPSRLFITVDLAAIMAFGPIVVCPRIPT